VRASSEVSPPSLWDNDPGIPVTTQVCRFVFRLAHDGLAMRLSHSFGFGMDLQLLVHAFHVEPDGVHANIRRNNLESTTQVCGDLFPNGADGRPGCVFCVASRGGWRQLEMLHLPQLGYGG
jgi:hypothetical protein